MKSVKIEIRIDEITNRIGTIIDVFGYDKNNMSHQLEILGLLENLKTIQQENISTLGKKTI